MILILICILSILCKQPSLESTSYLSTATEQQNYIYNGNFQLYPNSKKKWIGAVIVKAQTYFKSWKYNTYVGLVQSRMQLLQYFQLPSKNLYQLDFDFAGDFQFNKQVFNVLFNSQLYYESQSIDGKQHSVRLFVSGKSGNNSINFKVGKSTTLSSGFSIDNIVLRKISAKYLLAYEQKYQVTGYTAEKNTAIQKQYYFAGYLQFKIYLDETCSYIISFQWGLYEEIQGIQHNLKVFFSHNKIFEVNATQIDKQYQQSIEVLAKKGSNTIYIDSGGYKNLYASSFRIHKNYIKNGGFDMDRNYQNYRQISYWSGGILSFQKYNHCCNLVVIPDGRKQLIQKMQLNSGIYILQFDYKKKQQNSRFIDSKYTKLYVKWNEDTTITLKHNKVKFDHFSVMVKAKNGYNKLIFENLKQFYYAMYLDNISLTKQ